MYAALDYKLHELMKKKFIRGLQSNKYGSLRRMAMHGFRLDCKSVKKTRRPNYSSPLKNKLIRQPHTIDIKPICFLATNFLVTFRFMVSVF